MNQLDLFREGDPKTSRVAAEQLDLAGAERAAMLAASCFLVPWTANEMATASTGYLTETVRKRIGGLIKKGLVKEVGAKACGVTGKMATTYEVVQC